MVILIVFIVCLMCGFICSSIASNKNLGGCLWFFIGFITGIFGIIIVLLAPPDKNENAGDASKQIIEIKKDFFNEIRLGISLIKENRLSDALVIFDSVIDSDPQNSAARYCRAVIKNKMGDYGSALTDLIVAAQGGHIKAREILNKKGVAY